MVNQTTFILTQEKSCVYHGLLVFRRLKTALAWHGMNPLLNNPEPQRIRASVYADGGANLIDGYLPYGVSFLPQYGKRLFPEGGDRKSVV